MAKTMQSDGTTWGNLSDLNKLAHASNKVACQTCHTSWVTSCFGCHLPMAANRKKPNLHSEGTDSRNWTQYNFQTLRDDVFMLGHDSTVHGNDVTTIRSSCAVLVDSQNAEPRVALLAAADGLRRGLRRHGLLALLLARDPGRTPDEVLHRLPPLARQRQQREDGAAPDARHELLQLHRPLRLRRRGAARVRGGRGDRARRAAGRHRQLAPRARVSGALRRLRRRRPRLARPTPPTATTSGRFSSAASTSTRPAARTASSSTTSPTSTTRDSPRGSRPRRSRRSASGSTSRRRTRPRSPRRRRWRSIPRGRSCR